MRRADHRACATIYRSPTSWSRCSRLRRAVKRVVLTRRHTRRHHRQQRRDTRRLQLTRRQRRLAPRQTGAPLAQPEPLLPERQDKVVKQRLHILGSRRHQELWRRHRRLWRPLRLLRGLARHQTLQNHLKADKLQLRTTTARGPARPRSRRPRPRPTRASWPLTTNTPSN